VTAPITGTPPASTQLPTTTGSSSNSNPLAGLNDSLNANDFLQLLVTQMTHQDPTAPTDDTQMASQLAQFASLSQLSDINTTLTGQSSSTGNLTTSIDNSAALNLIGKTVTASSSQIAVGGTSATTSVSTTTATSGDLVLTITDSNGNTVSTKDLGQVTAGNQSVQLAALTSGLPAAAYNVQFSLKDSSGNVTNPTAMITATVDGVTFASGGAEATSGPLTIPIGSIASVTSN
jgi:flagellar basal-body rod modification protein FlgD